MNIETFVSIKPTIQNGKLIIIFDSNDNIITELRVLKVADEIHKLLEELKSDKIKEFYFLFQVDNIKIPTNFSYIEEIALSLFKYKDLIIQKLNFSVVQCKNNIFLILMDFNNNLMIFQFKRTHLNNEFFHKIPPYNFTFCL